MADYFAQIDALIERNGFATQLVAGDEDPGFAYTIGLTLRGMPETIFVGSGHPAAANYVGGFARALLAGLRPAYGMHAPRTGPNGFDVPVWLMPADEKLATHALGVTSTLRRLGRPQTATLNQVIMPDKQGRFPWEPNYDWLDQAVTNPPTFGTA